MIIGACGRPLRASDLQPVELTGLDALSAYTQRYAGRELEHHADGDRRPRLLDRGQRRDRVAGNAALTRLIDAHLLRLIARRNAIPPSAPMRSNHAFAVAYCATKSSRQDRKKQRAEEADIGVVMLDDRMTD
jgi:hypothetical protein